MPSDAPVPAVEILIHHSRRFDADVDILLASDPLSEAVVEGLVDAFDHLWNDDPGLPIKQYGWYGDSFLYEFSLTHAFTFRVSTDRDAQKLPIRRHYYLKQLLRRRSRVR